MHNFILESDKNAILVTELQNLFWLNTSKKCLWLIHPYRRTLLHTKYEVD